MPRTSGSTSLKFEKSLPGTTECRAESQQHPLSHGEIDAHFDRLSGELSEILDRFDVKSLGYRSVKSVESSATPEAQQIGRVRGMIAARARRSRFFHGDLFADPAWSILLDLYLASLEQRRTTISTLCVGSEVPATTALRWITTMVDRKLLVRCPDKLDRRRVYVELSDECSQSMADYLAATYSL